MRIRALARRSLRVIIPAIALMAACREIYSLHPLFTAFFLPEASHANVLGDEISLRGGNFHQVASLSLRVAGNAWERDLDFMNPLTADRYIAKHGVRSVLADHLRAALAQGYQLILLNVADLTYCDSVTLGAIVEAHTSAIRAGATLKLVHVTRRLRELLAVTKLDRVIESVESTDANVDSDPHV